MDARLIDKLLGEPDYTEEKYLYRARRHVDVCHYSRERVRTAERRGEFRKRKARLSAAQGSAS